MSFSAGIRKVAKKDLVDTISRVIGEGIESGSALGRGVRSTGSHTLGDTLKLKGLKHVPEAVKAQGGIGKALSHKAGRLALWEAAGKSVPSTAAASLYGGLAAKAIGKAYAASTEDPYARYY